MDIDNKNIWKKCFDVEGVRIPTGYYFGASAATGELAGIFQHHFRLMLFTLLLTFILKVYSTVLYCYCFHIIMLLANLISDNHDIISMKLYDIGGNTKDEVWRK